MFGVSFRLSAGRAGQSCWFWCFPPGHAGPKLFRVALPLFLLVWLSFQILLTHDKHTTREPLVTYRLLIVNVALVTIKLCLNDFIVTNCLVSLMVRPLESGLWQCEANTASSKSGYTCGTLRLLDVQGSQGSETKGENVKLALKAKNDEPPTWSKSPWNAQKLTIQPFHFGIQIFIYKCHIHNTATSYPFFLLQCLLMPIMYLHVLWCEC